MVPQDDGLLLQFHMTFFSFAGYETVRGLMRAGLDAQQGCHVILAARDQKACVEACEQLRKEFGASSGSSCSCCSLDLEDFASVRAFAASQEKELRRRNQKLDVLVNNGGIGEGEN